MIMPLLSSPEEGVAGGQEALVGGLLLCQAGEEGVVVLLDVDLQQVGGGQGLAADGAGVPGRGMFMSLNVAIVTEPVSSGVVGFRLVELAELEATAWHLAAELGVVHMQQLLYVLQPE